MNGLLVLATFIDLFAAVFNALIIVRLVMSYFAKPENRLYIGLIGLTEPVIAPVRRLVPPVGGVDWSPTLTIVALYILDVIVTNLIAPQ